MELLFLKARSFLKYLFQIEFTTGTFCPSHLHWKLMFAAKTICLSKKGGLKP